MPRQPGLKERERGQQLAHGAHRWRPSDGRQRKLVKHLRWETRMSHTPPAPVHSGVMSAVLMQLSSSQLIISCITGKRRLRHSVFLQRSPRHPPLTGLGSVATHNRPERADWKFSLVYVCIFILLLLRSHFQRLSDRFFFFLFSPFGTLP